MTARRWSSRRSAEFGSTLTGQIARADFEPEIELDFAPSGLRWHLECPAAGVVQAAG